MKQFVVPQFIEVEDKIIGPITTRQFMILLATGLLVALTFRLATFTLFIFLGLTELSIGIVFAFVKINGQPFHYFVLNLLQTSLRPALRVWNKLLTRAEVTALVKVPPPPPPKEKPVKERLTTSKLSELSLIVNTGGAYKPEE
ncbi:MAG: PrgI family protein [Patescibacteria group bacterium]|nr:PrgI family protein [Patescibacteria group bacterium]